MIILIRQMQRNLSAEKSILYILNLLAGNDEFKKMLKEKKADESFSDILNKYIKENSN